MAADLAKIAKEKKIKYFLISFVDLFGVLRAKLVPARAIGDMQKDGADFAGFRLLGLAADVCCTETVESELRRNE